MNQTKSGKRITPGYIRGLAIAGAPMMLYMAFYILSFYIIEHTNRLHYIVIHSALDDYIPFLEIFIIPYLLWFAYMILNVFYLFIADRETYYDVAKCLCIGMTIFIVFSIVCPNIQFLRPVDMPRDNIFTRLILRLYSTDTPTNVCPSIHVFNTMMVILGLKKSNAPLARDRRFRIPMDILGYAIILSTMFIKQHSVVDVTCALVMTVTLDLLVYRRAALPMFRRFRRKRQTGII